MMKLNPAATITEEFAERIKSENRSAKMMKLAPLIVLACLVVVFLIVCGASFLSPKNIMKTNYPVTQRQKRSRCRSNRGIIDSPTPLFTPFCRFRYRSRGQIRSHQYPRTSSTNDPFLKWFSYASRMMRIAMSTSPF